MSTGFNFTKSRDGVERVTIRLDLRLDRDEIEFLRSKCKRYDGNDSLKGVRRILAHCVDIGMDDLSLTEENREDYA